MGFLTDLGNVAVGAIERDREITKEDLAIRAENLQANRNILIKQKDKKYDRELKEYYKEKNRKLDIGYINLSKFYKKTDKFTDKEIQTFLNENSDKLKQDYIDFSYVLITPKNLIGLEEFNQSFFDKIDEIENKISKNITYSSIITELNIKPTTSVRIGSTKNNIIKSAKATKLCFIRLIIGFIPCEIIKFISERIFFPRSAL